MAKHEVILHENTGALREKAPYLGNYVTKNQVSLADACAAYAAKAGLPAMKMQTLIENDIEAFIDLEKSGACRIHVDGGYVELRITSSFPSSDSAWDASVNRLVVAFTPNEDVTNALINETGTIVTDETSTKVRVDNVFDVEHPKPTEVIYGLQPFIAQGVNEVMSDEGARIEFITDQGIVFPCDVLEQMNRQNVKCQLHELVPEGCDGKIVAYSRGGDPEGQLTSSSRKVKYIYVEPPVPPAPTLTKVYPSDEPDSEGWMKPNPYENTVEGTNLAAATKLEFKYMDGEDEHVDEFEIVSKTADKIVFKANAETMEDIGGHLIVTTPAGTCEGDFMATVMGS